MWNGLDTTSKHALVMASAVVDLVYPPHCLLCGGDIKSDNKVGLCDKCWNSIPVIDGSVCSRCGAPVGPHAANNKCSACRTRRFSFTSAAAAGLYESKLRDIILHMKYGRRSLLSKPAAILMVEAAERNDIMHDIDFIVPVPLHEQKLRERGFNQAELLARRIGIHMSVPVRDDVLVRIKNTTTQTGLNRSSRVENVSDAFTVSVGSYIRGARLLLVDDVMTTGSTLSECASVLKVAGAAEVRVLVTARD